MKKGVSLVTVLLFMMVATIAATATYKWLSSIGSSSAARLQISEARQAALSGIEAAQSWMTFNGNDLGAVIKQYFENEKKPILLNSVLPRMKSGKMLDSVWLMGVNVESSSRYKVKIVSQGTSRENVKYSEVAIFNVSGLYQAEIPTETYNVNYRDAFHGSLATADVIDVTSAFIKQTPSIKNGGVQALNSIRASEYLVLDGNFYVNNSGNVKDLYVTGDLSFLNSLNIGRNLYVGGTVYGTSTASHMSVFGSSYLNGGMKVNDRSNDVKNNGLYSQGEVTGGKFDFYGNVTSNGNIDHFKADASASYIEMHKNLVLNGKLVFPSSASANSYYIHVARNAYIRDNSTATGNVDAYHHSKTVFGSNVDDSLYLADFEPYSGNNDCGLSFNCARSTNEKIYVTYNGRLIMSSLSEEQYGGWNADAMKTYRDMFTEEKEDCGTYSVSKDKLQFNEGILSLTSTAGVSLVHSANAKNGCSEEIWNDNIEVPVKALNACFNIANNSNMLVDKTWLIVSWDHAPVWSSTTEKLNGNFIFVIDATSEPAAEFELPETNDDAKVFIYLPNGWGNKSSEHSLKTKGSSNARSNYFVYSKGDIGGFNMQISPLNGSVYMQGCAQLNTLKDDNTLAVRFNEHLFKSLVKSSILCESKTPGTCSPFVGSVSGFEGLDPYQTTDSYHIATSPQLIVEVESQYKNTEPLPKTTWDFGSVASSEVVLPRIIYLPRDARGRFSDYYNVVGLNYKKGMKASKDPSLMQCSGAIPTGNALLTSGGELTEGKYLCAYGDKGKQVPVYVVVEGSLNENAVVQFHDDDVEKKISPGNSTKVRLVATESDVPMTVTIKVDLPEDGSWHVQPAHSNVEYHSDLGVYTLTTTSSGGDVSIPVFDVKSDLQNAAEGVYFHIIDCSKCFPGDNRNAHVFTKNIATVQRKDIDCNEIDKDAFEQKYGFECKKLDDIPACGELLNVEKTTWVTARGLGCVSTTRNSAWECRTGGNEVNLESTLSESAYCTAYIPPMSVQLKNPEVEYKLPAELKRKHNPLIVKIEKPQGFSGSIRIKGRRGNSDAVNEICSGGVCTYDNLYAGDTVYFSKESGRALYYTCNGKSCGDYKPDEKINESPFKIILVGGRDSVTAWFGQKDAHCFYTNFSDFYKSGWCPSTRDENSKQCIDRCKEGLSSCSVNNPNQFQSQNAYADWVLVRSNYNNSFVKPKFTNYSMKTPDDIYQQLKFVVIIPTGIETFGNASVVLNTAQAGSNGLMTTMFTIPDAMEDLLSLGGNFISNLLNQPQLIDYGFVFRSTANGSEYFLLNVLNDKEALKPKVVKARLCYVNNQQYLGEKCEVKSFPSKFMDLLSSMSLDGKPLTFNIDVNGDNVSVVFSKNSGVETGALGVDFNLMDIFGKTLVDDSHQYVGINLGHPWKGKPFGQVKEYEFLDIGWRSYDYDEDCWDTPKVSCSFKANYIGGMVPDSTDVKPWVGMSSWFDGKGCKISYYYNGCDLKKDKMASPIPEDLSYHTLLNRMGYPDFFSNNLGNEIACRSGNSRPRGNGLYSFSARKLRSYNNNYGNLKDGIYWFEDEGYHGYPIEVQWDKNLATGLASLIFPNLTFNSANGVMNEASVIVSCESNEQNNNTHIYDASCGDFIVGEYERCTESYPDMLKDGKYCTTSSDGCFIELDDVYNVREATVSVVLDGFDASQIEGYLVDEDGVTSALGKFDKVADSEYKIDVMSISDVSGFNPQKLHGLVFKNGSYPFTVQRVWSKCPYEFGIRCNYAKYNFASTEWTVSASVVNPDRAKGGCEIVLIADGYEVPDTRVAKQCSEDFLQEFQHEVYGQSQLHTYAFKVLARDENNDVLDECTTEAQEFKPLEIQCKLNNSLDLQYVPQGTGVPQFSFSVANCPSEGCPYTLRYPSDFGLNPVTDVVVSSDDPTPIHPSGSINTPENKLSKGNYEYQLDVMGHSCPSGNVFEVVGEPEKGTCSNERIVHKEDGEYFEADVTFADGGYWNGTILDSVTVVYTDPLGNVMNVKTEKNEKGSQTYEFKKEVTVSHKLPAGMSTCNQGVCNYIVVFKIYGDDECSYPWTARKIMSISSSGCITESITGQNPLNEVSFTPVIGGCEDGGCTWALSGASSAFGGSGYDGKQTLTFSDPSAAGTKTYQFLVSPTDAREISSQSQSCSFSVTYTNDALDVGNCGFVEDSYEWGGQARYSFTTNCANCSYSLKSASGFAVSGTTNTTAGSSTETESFRVSKQEKFELTVNGKKIDECARTPIFKMIEPNCSVDKNALYKNEATTFRASFGNVCKDNSGCDWTWELKKNEGNSTGDVSMVNNGNINSRNSIAQNIVGGGTYALYINDRKECEVTVTDKGDAPVSSVEGCHFAAASYAYGATDAKFVIDKLSANDESWTIKKGSSTFASGTGLNKIDDMFTASGSNDFKVAKSTAGTYKFELSPSGKSCTAELNVQLPTVSCKLSSYRDWGIKKYKVDVTASNCKNGCLYILYKSKDEPSNESNPNEYEKKLQEGTIYNTETAKDVGNKWFRVVLVENGSEIAVGTCK